MDKNNYKSPLLAKMIPYIIFIMLFSFVLYFVLTGLGQAGAVSDAEGLRIAENSLTRAVINCYASEGKYPPSYEYLQTHYGISIDENKYIIHYAVFAENIMPDITILRVER
jgi:hypothetical protein